MKTFKMSNSVFQRLSFFVRLLLIFFLIVGCDVAIQETNTTVFEPGVNPIAHDMGRKFNPAWSPDGKTIAYSVVRDTMKIKRYSLDGVELQDAGFILDNISGGEALSPDGKQFVYQSQSQNELWRYDLITGASEPMLKNWRGNFTALDWNGNWLAFRFEGYDSRNDYHYRRLFYMAADDSIALLIPDTTDFSNNNPSISPDGQKIAFSSVREKGFSRIYILDLTSTEITPLTSDSVNCYDPDWSPNGQAIVYEKRQYYTFGTVREIWLSNLVDTTHTQLTDSTDSATDPVWSPDGTKIAYDSGAIEIINLQGELLYRNNSVSVPRWYADSSSLITYESTREYSIETYSLGSANVNNFFSESNGFFVGLSWFPDGQNLAFIMNGSVYSVAKYDRFPERLVYLGSDVAVSPDGKWLAYNYSDVLYFLPLEQDDNVEKGTFIRSYSNAEWSPDGKFVICNSGSQLVVFSFDDGKLNVQYSISGAFINSAWSAGYTVAGEYIAAEGGGGIYIMRPDGSDQRFFIQNGSQPDWSPDGSKLVFVRDSQLYLANVFEELK